MNKNNINTRALLVSLTTHVFNPTRLDRAVTGEVTQSKNAARDAGDFKRRVIPKAMIDPVVKAANSAYLKHKQLTSPWEDGGTRLLCIDMFDKYVDDIAAEIRIFEAAVAKFLKEYEHIRTTAPVRMGALFNPKDYPPIEEVRSRFAIETKWLPLPNGSDFRIHLRDEDLAELSASVETRVAEAVEAARLDLHDRLRDRLSRISERLSDPDKVFRDSLIENLRELCTLIPGMSITPDPVLLGAVEQANRDLATCDPQELRDDQDKRAAARAAADAILRTMGGPIPNH